MKNLFEGEPEGREATREFVEYVGRLRDDHPHLNDWTIAIQADRVLLVNPKLHVAHMTTKAVLHEFWPVKVEGLERAQDEQHKTRIQDTGHHDD